MQGVNKQAITTIWAKNLIGQHFVYQRADTLDLHNVLLAYL